MKDILGFFAWVILTILIYGTLLSLFALVYWENPMNFFIVGRLILLVIAMIISLILTVNYKSE